MRFCFSTANSLLYDLPGIVLFPGLCLKLKADFQGLEMKNRLGKGKALFNINLRSHRK